MQQPIPLERYAAHDAHEFMALTAPATAELRHQFFIQLIKGSLEVKLPTIWTDKKAEVRRVREDKTREEK